MRSHGHLGQIPSSKKAVVEVLMAKFPNLSREDLAKAVGEVVQSGDAQNQIRARKGQKPEEWRKGAVVASASSKFQPGIAGPDFQPIINPAHFYGGCYGAVEVALNPYVSDKDGSVHCGLYLNYVIKTRDGEKLGGVQRSAADVFAGVVPSAAAVNPLTGVSDADLAALLG